MWKTTLKIDGMHCGMCEARVNELLRGVDGVKRAKASRTKGGAEIVTETPIAEETWRKALDGQGYEILSVETEEYVKKAPFAFLRRKR